MSSENKDESSNGDVQTPVNVASSHDDNSFLDPVSRLEVDHALQFRLCDVLETVADDLPGVIDPSLLLFAVPVLRNDLRQHMWFEEKILFPLLRKRIPKSSELNSIMDQLAHEHEVDEAYGDELADQLENLAFKGEVENPDMVGYMLRGFFESQRRHIEWENTVILPLARQVLTPEDIDELNRALPIRSDGGEAGIGVTLSLDRAVPSTCSGNCTDCKKPN